MDNLYLNTIQRLKEQIPSLSYIDEEYGQLTDEKRSYPITYPALLVADVETDWTNRSPVSQTGTGSMRTLLIIDCYHDTHQGSGQEDNILQRAALDQQVYAALQGWRWSSLQSTGTLKRMKSKHYSIDGMIKVYETIWSYDIVDQTLKR